MVNPPQTQVYRTSIATGLDLGGHGVFDFFHLDPVIYTPYLSLLPTRHRFVGIQFVPPFKTCTVFEKAAQHGLPATALWWPANFRAQPEALARTIPGLGTPNIQGRIGGVTPSQDPESALSNHTAGSRLVTDVCEKQPMQPAEVTNRHAAERHLGAMLNRTSVPRLMAPVGQVLSQKMVLGHSSNRYETARVLLPVIHPMTCQEATMTQLRRGTAKRTQPHYAHWYDSPPALEQEGIVK